MPGLSAFRRHSGCQAVHGLGTDVSRCPRALQEVWLLCAAAKFFQPEDTPGLAANGQLQVRLLYCVPRCHSATPPSIKARADGDRQRTVGFCIRGCVKNCLLEELDAAGRRNTPLIEQFYLHLPAGIKVVRVSRRPASCGCIDQHHQYVLEEKVFQQRKNELIALCRW